jgi:hypothetical protein
MFKYMFYTKQSSTIERKNILLKNNESFINIIKQHTYGMNEYIV